MDIKFEGLDKVLDSIDGLVDRRKLKSAMIDVVSFVENVAAEKAPKDTGNLMGSIESKVEDNGVEIVGTVFTPVYYSVYQEYGTGLFAENGDGRKTGWAYEDPKTGETVWTRGNRPHPFMRPALTENKDVIIQVIKEALHD